MKLPNITQLFTLLTVLMMIAPLTRAQEYEYSTREAYIYAGYEYYWSVLQSEFDQRSFDTQVEREQYFELLDIMVRTDTGYGHTYYSIPYGITQMYPRLVKLDPDPPLYAQYRFHSAIFDWKSTREQNQAAGMALIEIAKRMSDAGYPPLFEAQTWLKASFILTSAGLGDDKETKDAHSLGIDLLLKAARLDGIEPRFRERIAKKVYNFCYINRSHLSLAQMEQFCYRLFADPLIDPWIAHAGYGNFLISKAWIARSHKFASKVTDPQWEMFRFFLTLSGEHLTIAWEMRPEWTAPASEMITVTMGHQNLPDRDERFWFNEVTSRQYDHSLAYEKLSTARRSRWGGSNDMLSELLDHIIAISRTHEHMGVIFMNTAAQFAKDMDDPNEIFTRDGYLEHATRMMKEEIESPLGSTFPWTTRGYLELLAMQHFLKGDYEECALLLKGGGANAAKFPKPWKADPRFETYNEIIATEFTEEVIRAIRAADENNYELTLEILTKIDAVFKDQEGDLYPEIRGDHKGPLNNLIIKIRSHGHD